MLTGWEEETGSGSGGLIRLTPRTHRYSSQSVKRKKREVQTYICLNDAPCISQANVSICPVQMKPLLQILLGILVNLKPSTSHNGQNSPSTTFPNHGARGRAMLDHSPMRNKENINQHFLKPFCRRAGVCQRHKHVRSSWSELMFMFSIADLQNIFSLLT